MTQRALRTPFIVACAGGASMLVTVVLAARTDTADPGSGFVFITILGYGMIASGLLLVGAAVGARRLVSQGAAMRARHDALVFWLVGVIGAVATLYGAAVLIGG